jgi:ABC-type multidrug transport system ATPase subunit
MNTLTVKITGPKDAGKSTLAKMVVDALKDLGVEVEVRGEIVSMPSPPSTLRSLVKVVVEVGREKS